MTLKSGPGLGLLVNAAPGEGHYNELTRLLRGLDALIQPNVISRVATVPTSGMADGDRYLLTEAPNAGAIARYSTDLASPAWEYYSPRNGWYVWSIADQKGYRYKGSAAAWGEESTGGAGEALGTAAPASGALNLADATKSIWDINLTGNVTTITLPSNIPVPLGISLMFTQDSTGGRTVTWPSSVTWQSGVAPAVNVMPGARTIVSLLTIDGGSTWLGFYDFQGGTLGRALNEAPIVSTVSSGTLAIGAVASNTIQVTGTTTITAFDTAPSGAKRMLRFSDALTLTYDATKLILPGQANITTVAGDVAEFVSLGGGNWICFNYQRASLAGAKGDLALTKADVGLANVDNVSVNRYGLGTTAPTVDDLNNLTASQFFNGVSGVLNAPATPPISGVNVTYSATGALQLSASLLDNRFFWRSKAGGTWSGYKEAAPTTSPTFTGTLTHNGASVVLNPSTSANANMEIGYTGGAASTPYQDWHSGATAVDYDYRMIASGGTGAAGGGMMTFRGAQLYVDNPLMTVTGEIRSTGINSYRQAAANYGTFWRNDNSNLYLMVTASGDPNGTFNALRPFSLSLATGLVTMGNGLSVTGQLTSNSGIVASQINSNGPVRVGQYTLSTLPSASAYSGYEIDVTDASGGAKRCRSNGTNWLILNTTTPVS